MDHDRLDHESLATLLAPPLSEEPVVSLYVSHDGNAAERRLVLKNLIKDGEELIRRDTGFDDERRKRAFAELDRTRQAAENAFGPGTSHGSFVAFAWAGRIETFRLPVRLGDRVVVDRTPFTSPLAALLEQYEHYGIVVVDHKQSRILAWFLGTLTELETVTDTATKKISYAGFHGLEEARKNHHQEYVLHRHFQHTCDRLFQHNRKRAFDRLVLGGLPENVTKLERRLHPYLASRVVAREHWKHDISKDELRRRVHELETRVEEEKERVLLARIRDHVCGDLLATTGYEETLRALYYGKVAVLVVDALAQKRGRECPECRYLFPRPEDAQDHAPVLVPCPLCNRPTRAVPDIVDEAVELAILSGSKVEHVSYARDELAKLGGIASELRFR
jgi:peptide subunit release factor 1 (eRF1)